MKKFLLMASMLVMGVVATFAQNWAVGDEITGKIGNPSFTEDAIAPWTFNHSGGNTTETGGLCELYNGSESDLFQYIELPAGMYKLECQGYYRIGQSWDVDPNTFNTDEWVDEAQLYVQNGKYNVDTKQFIGGRTFKTPLMPRLFDYQATQIYEDLVKEGWDMSDGHYEVGPEGNKTDLGWGPCSVPGSLMWFEAGKYKPYDDDDVKYNTVTFFLTEDGYVKIGVSKAASRNADSRRIRSGFRSPSRFSWPLPPSCSPGRRSSRRSAAEATRQRFCLRAGFRVSSRSSSSDSYRDAIPKTAGTASRTGSKSRKASTSPNPSERARRPISVSPRCPRIPRMPPRCAFETTGWAATPPRSSSGRRSRVASAFARSKSRPGIPSRPTSWTRRRRETTPAATPCSTGSSSSLARATSSTPTQPASKSVSARPPAAPSARSGRASTASSARNSDPVPPFSKTDKSHQP